MTSELNPSLSSSTSMPISGPLNSRKEAICDKILEHSGKINARELQPAAYYDNVGVKGGFSIKEKVQFKRFFKGFTLGFTHFKEKALSAEKMSKIERGVYAALAVGSFFLSLSNVALGIPGLLSAAIYCGLTNIDDESLKKQDSKDNAEKSMQELNTNFEPRHVENPLSPYKQLMGTTYNHNTGRFDTPRDVDEKFTQAELIAIKNKLEEFVKKIKDSHPELAKTHSMQRIEEHIAKLTLAADKAGKLEVIAAYNKFGNEIINDLDPDSKPGRDAKSIAMNLWYIFNQKGCTRAQLSSTHQKFKQFILSHPDIKKETEIIKDIEDVMERLQHAANIATS